MTAAPPPKLQNNTQESSGNVLSMTDDGLARRFQFQAEHGIGNWGSVWLAADKRSSQSPLEKNVAIKLVHRSKTQTTAARVRALWNEMKTVQSLRENGECHPSIVAFDCFIITPSYALIVMEFLPTLLPVPVDENTAKPWMASLSSAVEFMHSRGVVHNDIKPANILLSTNDTPTLVDFGFSERYDTTWDSASEPSHRPSFLSSLAYGTPEYLSPERAAGQMHDTRKADVWSLGVTFFELLFNRTPFEHDRGIDNKGDKEDNAVVPVGCTQADKASMDVYWSRTVKGKWHGASGNKLRSRMSAELEALLRRMISPNADIRYTSLQVLKDPYWNDVATSHTRGIKARPMSTGVPVVHADPATPVQPATLSSMVRTALGNKQNIAGAGRTTKSSAGQIEQKLAISPGSGVKVEGKENTIPRSPRLVHAGNEAPPAKIRKEKPSAKPVKTPVSVKSDESVESTSPVEQEARRVHERVADISGGQGAVSVRKDRTVEGAKKMGTRGNSQSLLPPPPRLLIDASISTSQKSSASPSPVPASVSASTSKVTRTRANHVFTSKAQVPTHRRAVAIGNTADLNGPVQVLRHVVSADCQFSGKAIDGQEKDSGAKKDGVKVVVDNRAGIRKIKSDLVQGHARIASYNSTYPGKDWLAPVPIIPEVRVEDADSAEKNPQVIVATSDNAKPTSPEDTERFYDQLIIATNIVERNGKGYQSNICQQNDHATLRKSAITPTSLYGRPAGPMTNAIRQEAFVPAADAPTVSACPPARPRRKVRQAASFDGFRNFARLDKGQTQAPTRPLSEHLPSTSTRDPCATPSKVEKRRSTVTKTMRKAFFAIMGGASIEKAH